MRHKKSTGAFAASKNSLSALALAACLPLMAAGPAFAQDDQLDRYQPKQGSSSSPAEAGCIPTPKVDPLFGAGFSSSASLGACGNTDDTGARETTTETASIAQGYGGFGDDANFEGPGDGNNPGDGGGDDPVSGAAGIFGTLDTSAPDLGLTGLEDGIRNEIGALIDDQESLALGLSFDDQDPTDGELITFLSGLAGGGSDDPDGPDGPGAPGVPDLPGMGDGDGDGDGTDDDTTGPVGIFGTLDTGATDLGLTGLPDGISNEVGALIGDQESLALGLSMSDQDPTDGELITFLSGLLGGDGTPGVPGEIPTDPPNGVPTIPGVPDVPADPNTILDQLGDVPGLITGLVPTGCDPQSNPAGCVPNPIEGGLGGLEEVPTTVVGLITDGLSDYIPEGCDPQSNPAGCVPNPLEGNELGQLEGITGQITDGLGNILPEDCPGAGCFDIFQQPQTASASNSGLNGLPAVGSLPVPSSFPTTDGLAQLAGLTGTVDGIVADATQAVTGGNILGVVGTVTEAVTGTVGGATGGLLGDLL